MKLRVHSLPDTYIQYHVSYHKNSQHIGRVGRHAQDRPLHGLAFVQVKGPHDKGSHTTSLACLAENVNGK